MIILSVVVAPIWQSMHLTFLSPSRLCAAARVSRLLSTGWNSVNFFSCRWQAVQNVLFSSRWSVTTMPPPNAAAPSRGTPTRRRGSQRRIVRIPGPPGAYEWLLYAHFDRVGELDTSGWGPVPTRWIFVLPAL